MKRILLVILLLAVAAFAEPSKHRSTYHRSRAVTSAFQRSHPCPSTGRKTGACPGYVKDHVVALCAGGSDSVSNMQWQTTAAAKAKDKTECGSRRRR